MRVKVWQDTDYVACDIPDALLRPVVEHLLAMRAWDGDWDRVTRMVKQMRLAVHDHLLVEAQRGALATQEPPAEPDRMAKARAALAAKRAAKKEAALAG